MSSDPDLPAYSQDRDLPTYSEHEEEPAPSDQITANCIVGIVQRCAIKDQQYDCLQVIRRESSGKYHICRSGTTIPIYRVEFVENPDPTIWGDVVIIPVADIWVPPVASARIFDKPKTKKDPIATFCTSKPHKPNANWRPLFQKSTFLGFLDYYCELPIVTVPGTSTVEKPFGWTISERFCQFWWSRAGLPFETGELPLTPQGDRACLFAIAAPKESEEERASIIEIRRGGGLEFELAVVLQVFVIHHHRGKNFV